MGSYTNAFLYSFSFLPIFHLAQGHLTFLRERYDACLKLETVRAIFLLLRT